MKYTRYVVAEVRYDSEETWKETEKDISDVIEMLTNLKRKAKILEIRESYNVDDGQNK
tara:strand:- start:489 stop:662 length:174 start_codon:yes stop_codon:yes gene_type:complete